MSGVSGKSLGGECIVGEGDASDRRMCRGQYIANAPSVDTGNSGSNGPH